MQIRIRIRATGQVLSEDAWRASLENVTVPAELTTTVLEDLKADRVFYTPAPAYDPTKQTVVEVAPTQDINGTWQQTWAIVPLAADKIAQVQRNKIQWAIQALEDSITARMVREALLGSSAVISATGFTALQTIAQVDKQIAELRNTIAS